MTMMRANTCSIVVRTPVRVKGGMASGCLIRLAQGYRPGPGSGGRRILRRAKEGVGELSGSEANRVVRRQPRISFGGRDLGTGALLVEVTGVQRDRLHFRWAPRQGDPLVQLDQLGQRPQG